MSKQFCFKVNNPKKFSFDIDELKTFVNSLYIGDDKYKFKEDDTIPFLQVYDKVEDDICIWITSKGKANLEKIEKINDALTPKMLTWKNGITLSKPWVYTEINLMEDIEPKEKGKKAWETLQQNGPYFTHLMIPYNYLGAHLTYNGKKYQLTPGEEKVARFYANRLITESKGNITAAQLWTTGKDGAPYRQNFWNDFKTYLPPQNRAIFKDLNKVGWEDLIEKIRNIPPLTKEQKEVKKVQDEERKRIYGFAYLDGRREPLSNYTVEPAGIYEGRGKNPLRGKIKREIMPEDVTLNISKGIPIPPTPQGHKWGKIIHNQNVEWVAQYKDPIKNQNKDIRFDPKGSYKVRADLLKYAVARKLQLHLQTVRDKYLVDADTNDLTKKQLGTVLYLIDNYGLRVGSEKDADKEAETVGATTLQVEHIKLKKPDRVIFDFLGKDSVQYYKELQVPPMIFNNFEILIRGKSPGSQIFNKISEKSVNTYLHEFDKNFTAKVFRTRLASSIMYEALKSVKIPADSSNKRVKALFTVANAKVATVLNHTKGVTAKSKENVEKLKQKLVELEKEFSEKKKQKQDTKKLEQKIETTKDDIQAKSDSMNSALGTSLQNYIDPRLVVSWAETQDVEPSAVYTATLMKKFAWAIEVTEDEWDWLDSPLTINDQLDPSENPDMGVVVSGVKPPVVKPPVVKPPVVKPPVVINVGTLKDYKLLLKICIAPGLYSKEFANVGKESMQWMYPFVKYARDEKGFNTQFISNFIRYYEIAYK